MDKETSDKGGADKGGARKPEERFGVRFGLVPREGPQKIMTADLEIDVWNAVYEHWISEGKALRWMWVNWARLLAQDLGDLDVITLFVNRKEIYKALKDRFAEIARAEPHKVYELVETLCRVDDPPRVKKFEAAVRHALAANQSMFVLSEGRFRARFSKSELDEIARAPGTSDNGAEHVEKALAHMDPARSDYGASIAESVKLVESAAKRLHGKDCGLSGHVEAIDAMLGLHPEMKALFKKMYDFANKCGARHSNTDSVYRADILDARLALVWCAAMANYLAGKAGAAGLPHAGGQANSGGAGQPGPRDRANGDATGNRGEQ